MIDYSGLAIPKPEPHKRVKARADRQQARADKLVYQDVDRRDGLKSRLSGIYCGKTIERHHIRPRSLGGPTTTANVISLTQGEHYAVHQGRLVIEMGEFGADGEVVFVWRAA